MYPLRLEGQQQHRQLIREEQQLYRQQHGRQRQESTENTMNSTTSAASSHTHHTSRHSPSRTREKELLQYNSTFTFKSRNVPTVIFLCISAPIEFERSRAGLMTTLPVTPWSLSQWEMMSTQLASVTHAPPHTSSITDRISASGSKVRHQPSFIILHHSYSYQGSPLALSVIMKELNRKE